MTRESDDYLHAALHGRDGETEEAAMLARLPPDAMPKRGFVTAGKLEEFLEFLLNHFKHEEEVIFRAVEAFAVKEDMKALVAELRSEHAAIRAQADKTMGLLRGAVYPLGDDALAKLNLNLQLFNSLVLKHARKEDERLYPRVREHAKSGRRLPPPSREP